MPRKLIILTVFGAAMGWWEGVVVVYIRKILQLSIPDLTRMVMGQVPRDLLSIEMTREAATIIMLVAVALMLEKNWWRRLAVFLWVFAVWDLVYYAALKVLIGWPPSFATIDCLFLIPAPWIAPVWVPVLTMAGFLVFSGWLFLKIKE
ncbi:hypothetical protein COY52_06360 [Candidatus Desantisbacteria bacterium CG_4_10_14_0_8_um_filter_48_22]|uniref:Uncharacterized protein n=1 Tax=Candidatus Desantisbacteria bacterium CG_4_10_14_0_8_um_filter_48_22 TaxID=1974543 RepID=A0A2M7SAW0_9BACT|nr:MAG: hypothetical protein AUJ67_05505 [Candidatus Desantisbacteria bacterium CG1_02_49_89]PIV55307.1 MAG: hypothetical protein COS16_07570 [Candidatus Desantisbacteria bacterium CG02_land_8_20_14_3_00_49_13]PIZ16662.1 MAG: hypothetical protein COY52_06360 [Candidatus Desantisbacteria bacterium CG_4_10_14_0_8_um_filter_48_22]